mgnify:CR=1 FL=1
MGFLKNLGFALPTGTGGKGYRAHVQGNQLSDQGKPEEARKKHEEALKYYELAAEEIYGIYGDNDTYRVIMGNIETVKSQLIN